MKKLSKNVMVCHGVFHHELSRPFNLLYFDKRDAFEFRCFSDGFGIR